MISTQWRPTVSTVDTYPAIVIDGATSENLSIHRALMASNLPGLLTWDGPIRSPASKGEDKRVLFTGFFDRARVADLDVHLAVKLLRDNSCATRRRDWLT